jgi:hypothetical protein
MLCRDFDADMLHDECLASGTALTYPEHSCLF